MGNELDTSVIIGTRSRAELLRRALESLARQSVGPEAFEVIVVDDGSEDDTEDVLQEFERRQSRLRSIAIPEHRGLSYARNRGLDAASGEYILFTDDDCIADSDWVQHMRLALAAHEVVAGTVETPPRNRLKRAHNIAHFHPFMPGRKTGPVDFIAGANMGFRRRVLKELRGFDEGKRLAGDTHLCLKARAKGYIPHLAPEARVVHDPDYLTLAGAVKSAHAHAAATILLRNEFRSLLRTPFILRSPLPLRLLSPVIATGVTARIYFGNPRLLRRFGTLPLVWFLKLVWCWGAATGLSRAKTTDRSRQAGGGSDAAA